MTYKEYIEQFGRKDTIEYIDAQALKGAVIYASNNNDGRMEKRELDPDSGKIFYVEFSHPSLGGYIRDAYADIEYVTPSGQYGHYKSIYDKGTVTLADGRIFDFNTKDEHDILPVRMVDKK